MHVSTRLQGFMELSYRGNTSFFEIIKLNEFTDNLLLLLSTKLESMNLKPQAGWWCVWGGGYKKKECSMSDLSLVLAPVGYYKLSTIFLSWQTPEVMAQSELQIHVKHRHSYANHWWTFHLHGSPLQYKLSILLIIPAIAYFGLLSSSQRQ